MLRRLIILLLIVGHRQLLGSDLNGYYISPGIQIGVNSPQEFFLSYQATFGLITEYGCPGITLGRRHYKNREITKWETYNYIDAQIAFWYFGTGVGMIFDNSNIFYKYKLFAGAGTLLLGTCDYINFKNKPNMHYGGFVVLPIPIIRLDCVPWLPCEPEYDSEIALPK